MELTKTKLKQTEIGLIPEDWEIDILDSICKRIGDGIHSTPNYVENGEYFFVNGNNLIKGKITITENTKRVSKKEFSLHKRELNNLSLLISINGTIGNIAFYNGEKIVLGKSAAYINLSNKVSKQFIYQLLQTKFISDYFINELTGSTIKNLGLGSIRNTPIPLPPLPEQKAIAQVLSDTDNLIQIIAQKLAKKRAIKQGAMQQLLTPKEDWETKTLLELADSKKQLFDDGDWIESEHITSQGVRLIQTGNIGIGKYVEKENKKFIYESSFEKLNCKELFEGDLLICRLAEPAGRACVLPKLPYDKIVTSVDVTIFRPRPEVANRVFLMNIFSTSEWFKQVYESVGGTTHKRISRGSLGKVSIKLPSIEKQTEIATILSNMDAEIEQLEQKLSKYKMVKQGLMQNLLTGKIRLV